jgi:hypothetical protein
MKEVDAKAADEKIIANSCDATKLSKSTVTVEQLKKLISAYKADAKYKSVEVRPASGLDRAELCKLLADTRSLCFAIDTATEAGDDDSISAGDTAIGGGIVADESDDFVLLNSHNADQLYNVKLKKGNGRKYGKPVYLDIARTLHPGEEVKDSTIRSLCDKIAMARKRLLRHGLTADEEGASAMGEEERQRTIPLPWDSDLIPESLRPREPADDDQERRHIPLWPHEYFSTLAPVSDEGLQVGDDDDGLFEFGKD